MNFETWLWQPELSIHKGQVAFVQNNELPFLKGQWVFPGKIKKVNAKPAQFDVKHGITRFDIYIQIKKKKLTADELKSVKLVALDQVKRINPTSLIQKILEQGMK